MDELIVRLETATTGSDELDALVIARLVDGTVALSPVNGRWCVYQGTDRSSRPRSWEPRTEAERNLRREHADGRGPTRSLDAALTLLPEGWSWKLVWEPGRALYCAVLTHAERLGVVATTIVSSKRTAPLAVCIVALSARAEKEG